jgi:hypothetical protein
MATPDLHWTDDVAANQFYAEVMRALRAGGVPFLVGGTYALERHAGFSRGTKDLDLFVDVDDWPRLVRALGSCGFETELTFPHWLGKVFGEGRMVDFVFAGGNGLARVDRRWFEHGVPAEVCGEQVLICAAEELIWSKSFVMERERFDGADVLHLLRASGSTLDWHRLLRNYGEHWRVLLAHVVLFGFVYPHDLAAVPSWVVADLCARAVAERPLTGSPRLCRGTLLSREQYLVDVMGWGYQDARLLQGTMTEGDVRLWTDAALREREARSACD